MRISRQRYFADILRDGRVHFELWHWIVQHRDSEAILGMGQERAEDDARKCAEACIAELARLSRIKTAG